MPTTIVNEPNNLLLAKTLNELISKSGDLTPASLARKLGIPTNKITRILNGDVTDPKASTLLQIAHCFGITIDQLLGNEPITRTGEYGDLEASQLLPIFELSCMDSQQSPKEWYRWIENGFEGDYIAVYTDTDLYEPTFPYGSLLVINLDLQPEDRSFVIVKSKDNKGYSSIKKYVTEGQRIYLYPINPKLPIETYDDSLYTISGVILEVHQKLRSKK